MRSAVLSLVSLATASCPTGYSCCVHYESSGFNPLPQIDPHATACVEDEHWWWDNCQKAGLTDAGLYASFGAAPCDTPGYLRTITKADLQHYMPTTPSTVFKIPSTTHGSFAMPVGSIAMLNHDGVREEVEQPAHSLTELHALASEPPGSGRRSKPSRGRENANPWDDTRFEHLLKDMRGLAVGIEKYSRTHQTAVASSSTAPHEQIERLLQDVRGLEIGLKQRDNRVLAAHSERLLQNTRALKTDMGYDGDGEEQQPHVEKDEVLDALAKARGAEGELEELLAFLTQFSDDEGSLSDAGPQKRARTRSGASPDPFPSVEYGFGDVPPEGDPLSFPPSPDLFASGDSWVGGQSVLSEQQRRAPSAPGPLLQSLGFNPATAAVSMGSSLGSSLGSSTGRRSSGGGGEGHQAPAQLSWTMEDIEEAVNEG